MVVVGKNRLWMLALGGRSMGAALESQAACYDWLSRFSGPFCVSTFQKGAAEEKAMGKSMLGSSEKKVKILEHQRNEVSRTPAPSDPRPEESLAHLLF